MIRVYYKLSKESSTGSRNQFEKKTLQVDSEFLYACPFGSYLRIVLCVCAIVVNFIPWGLGGQGELNIFLMHVPFELCGSHMIPSKAT